LLLESTRVLELTQEPEPTLPTVPPMQVLGPPLVLEPQLATVPLRVPVLPQALALLELRTHRSRARAVPPATPTLRSLTLRRKIR
jgi:hypothetical protein